MLENEGLEKVLSNIKSIDEGVDIYAKYYNDEIVKVNGVVAIGIELVESKITTHEEN